MHICIEEILTPILNTCPVVRERHLFRKVIVYTVTSSVHCLQCVLGNSIISRGLWLCFPDLNLCSFYLSMLEDKCIVTALTLQTI